MSNHWAVITQVIEGVEQQREFLRLLGELTALNPARAERLRVFEDPEVIAQIAQESLVLAAERTRNCALAERYENWRGNHSENDTPMRGTCVGVLRGEGCIQVGVAIEGGQVSLFWNGYSAERRGELDRLITAWRQAHRERMIARAIEALEGETVERTELADGVIGFEAVIVQEVAS